MSTKLFASLPLRGLTLSNRVVVAPMCQYSADANGNPTDWHLAHWTQYVIAGAGLLIVEATAVEENGRLSTACLGLYSEENERHLAALLQRVRRFGRTPIVVQLNHGGRKASRALPWEEPRTLSAAHGGWRVLGPSKTPFDTGWPEPDEMTRDDIARVVDAFASSAARAVRAGFDGIEIHAAHGYLLSSFLSPLANHRSDTYGGRPENRRRLTLEVFEAVRAVCPNDMPVGLRLNGTDWVDGGISVEEASDLAAALARIGCDFIDVSSGGNAVAHIPVKPGYQVPLAAEIRRRSGLVTIAVGRIREPWHAESILSYDQADLVALGRSFLHNPRWVWHAAEELGVHVDVPPPYAAGATSRYRVAPGS